MEKPFENPAFLRLAVFAMLGMFLLAGAIVLFFMAYQKRLLREQAEREAERAAHQQELLRATVDSQEREQQRMAAELHDSAGALLSTTRLYLQQLRLQPQSPEAKSWLQTAENLVGDTVQTIRRIAQNLQPAELESIGLLGALTTLLDTLRGAGHLEVEEELPEQLPPLSPEAQLLLYRMTQELMSNTLKHARASTLRCTVRVEKDTLWLEVADDGVGFDRAQLNPTRRSMGLKTLESRAGLLNGTLTLESAPGRGTRTTVLVPLKSNTI